MRKGGCRSRRRPPRTPATASSGSHRSDGLSAPAKGGRAYEHIAHRLRELILDGELSPGQRLATETALANEFGVSRATVREALRLLAAQDLIRTAKGAAGGSFVTMPSVDHISEALRSGINLLAEARDVSLEELLEARALLEVPAARLAAERRTQEHLGRLLAAIPADAPKLGTSDQFVYNRDFHSVVIDASANTLLAIAAQPIFSVLQTNLARSRLGRAFHQAVNSHHRAIAATIQAGDADAAGGEMREHLEFLHPFYEKAWRQAKRTAVRP